MKLSLLRDDIERYIENHQLAKKWFKTKRLFEQDIKHPSLNVELLEPKWRGIYSFRIDRKYRAIYFVNANMEAEIIMITNHYKK